jgi:hypothetical protein
MQFVFGRISSPNAGADWRCPAMQNRIGWRRNGNWMPRFNAEQREPAVETMDNALTHLAQALRERLAVIDDAQSRTDEARHIARLRAVSEKIDRLQTSLPHPVNPQLKHYLDRKSYDKALEYLEGQM